MSEQFSDLEKPSTPSYEQQIKILQAVDCIIFGFDEDALKVLLIKRDFEPMKGRWSLMGGFVKESETLDASASRVLQRLTGLQNLYMEQLSTFSELNRDPVTRTISTAYYSLINIQNHNQDLIEKYSAQWFSLNDIPELIFDHTEMLNKAIRRLRFKTAIEPIGFELLPDKFTMKQLQKLYEAILNQELDKRNFIKKISELDVLIKLDEKDKSSSRKGSYLYKFNQSKYDQFKI